MAALRPLTANSRLRRLPTDLPLGDSRISTVAAHKSNIYIGTTSGSILHLHCFEDAAEYMLILNLRVTEKDAAVTKILPLPDVDLCLVVCNRTLYVYTLPELSPCHVGKIKDVNDVSTLSQVKNPKTKNLLDKAIVFTSTRLRVVQYVSQSVKLLRDIPYNGAVLGISSAAGTSANYSNICLVANGENYDVVDMQQTRRISLFEHNPEKAPGIRPAILPFDAAGGEEYLLPVRTNENMSMAMFINSVGDVTRGTLTWIDVGYPTNGMAVIWPHVLGLFKDGDALKLTSSSLETLEVVDSQNIEEVFEELELGKPGDLRIQRTNEPVLFAHEELSEWLPKVNIDGNGGPYVSLQPAHVVLHNEDSLFYMYEESSLYLKLKAVLDGLEEETDWEKQIEELDDEAGVLRLLYVILLLVTKSDKFTDAAHNFDPRIFLYLFEDLDKDVYDGLVLEKVVWRVLEHFRPVEVGDDFRSSFLKSVYSESDRDRAVFEALRLLIYQRSTVKSTIELVDSETDLWVSEHPSNEKLLGLFDEKGWNLVRLHVLLLQQKSLEEGTSVDNGAEEITALAFKLLEKRVEEEGLVISEDGVATKDDYSVDLVDVLITQLRDKFEDSDSYNKHLLELLKLFPDKGLRFLEANKHGKHKATHKHILEEYSKLHDLDAGFSSLKVEFIEQSFSDSLKEKGEFDTSLARELLVEQLEFLQSQHDSLAEEYVNLDILLSTFKVEHDLSNGHIPTINWIDYLTIHGSRSECKALAAIYTKIYELLLCLLLYGEQLPKVSFKDNDAMNYLSTLFFQTKSDERIVECLRHGDHRTADWFAIHDQPPFPVEPTYVSQIKPSLEARFTTRPEEDIKNSMKQILESYLLYEDSLSRNEGVKHLVAVFGGYFTLPELLHLMPSDLPLAFLYDYLTDVLVKNEVQKIDSDMIKILHRLDSKLTGKL
ncbi:uncharacterized protein CXQ87_001680 [Candidozyma duobushaemuli]|uniref:CNH domain-containing protein n=1 Tax=Candidozyma duobushaemuli TaxID=1231522 RepID=A0A2V1A833_9ASCO|nr:uncharacterized protein CXQ87_001680 [[Candida] duobushaemulonis]PVH13574.1 hypothetical protein CXQ87_001680 [[Candida] duobushaemulonis]